MFTLSKTSALKIGTLLVALAAPAGSIQAQPLSADSPVSFKLEVLPIFQGGCVQCHQPGGEGYEASGLDLRSYDGLMQGTKYGPMIVPGDPFTSNLMVMLEGRASPQIQMPLHRGRLRQAYINIIRHWIMEGAQDN